MKIEGVVTAMISEYPLKLINVTGKTYAYITFQFEMIYKLIQHTE